ncbi:MAG: hypothetical protein IPH78_01445 [Bacteroidetes bacterium]|nr:hypothetical protein [Bacteroidota bacterium]
MANKTSNTENTTGALPGATSEDKSANFNKKKTMPQVTNACHRNTLSGPPRRAASASKTSLIHFTFTHGLPV